MFIIKIMKKLLTNSSTAKQEEKQEERGSCQTLQATKKIGRRKEKCANHKIALNVEKK
ncbi:MAG: hypothetical protein P9L95_00325 [Candidatus Tenebribacter mawsonii]|nr:hypothetical protein [Candidatus Tenebribacter mawsonii]